MSRSDTRHNRPRAVGRVSRRGQITVPSAVRAHLGLDPGSAVEFVVAPDGAVVLRKRSEVPAPLRASLSAFARPGGVPPSPAELDAGIGGEVARLDVATRGTGRA